MQVDLTLGASQHQQLRAMAASQHGVLSHAQVVALGVSRGAIRAQVAAGRWTVLSPGVYCAVNSAPARGSQLWGALLASGEGAVLSHSTAAEIYGFGRSRPTLVEVSIPADRQEVSVRGVRVQRSRLLPAKATVHDGWPITSAEDTVLDLISEVRSPHAVVGVLTEACRSRVVSAQEILKAMGRRKRQRHRHLVKDALADVIGGVESNLEHKFLVRVERPHGLPSGRRQIFGSAHGATIRRDVQYDEFGCIVELDGRAGHEGVGKHRDHRRDNAGTRQGKATLRYGHADLEDACAVAAEVAGVLIDRGWTGKPTRCGRNCTATW